MSQTPCLGLLSWLYLSYRPSHKRFIESLLSADHYPWFCLVSVFPQIQNLRVGINQNTDFLVPTASPQCQEDGLVFSIRKPQKHRLVAKPSLRIYLLYWDALLTVQWPNGAYFCRDLVGYGPLWLCNCNLLPMRFLPLCKLAPDL